jgi:2-alkyl-3-oxoalkanoate reductase
MAAGTAKSRKPKFPAPRGKRVTAAARQSRRAVGAGGKAPRRPEPHIETAFSKALKEDISTVLVTGAASSVGVFLVQHLLRQGFGVIATDRKFQGNPFGPEPRGLLLKAGDLANPAFVASCLEGVGAVFHLSVYTETRLSRSEAAAFSVQGTQTLCSEARKKGVRRLIHVGSAMVYTRTMGPVDENVPVEARNEYEQGQILAERLAFAEAPPGLPVVTVIRAASIYGPRSTNQMASVATLAPLAKALGSYYLRLADGPSMNLVHAEDVARAALFLLLHPKALGQVFNVSDNNPMTFGEFVNQSMEAYGLKPLRPGRPYPPSTLLQSILPDVARQEIFNPLTHLSSLLWERMARKNKLVRALSPRIDQETLSFGTRDLVLDNRKLLDLGFRLKFPVFAKGWENTLHWYIEERWIPRPQDL